MRYCFYETTNLVNGKKYLGIHGSEDFEKDTYIGSGTLLQEAIQKYGRENFIRKDIRYFNKQKEAREFEALSITPEILRSSNYYNIAKGGGGGSVGSKPFYEGKVRYLVDPEAIEKFKVQHPNAVEGVPEEIGKEHSKKMLGRITVNNGKDHKLILQKDLQKYIKEGWTIGTTEELNLKNSNSKKGIKIMHLGDSTRHVRLEDVTEFLKKGYEFGPSSWISERNGKRHRGLVKVYKGAEIRFVSSDKVEDYIKQGYCTGTSSEERKVRSKVSRGKIFIHKDDREKRVPKEDMESYLREGWERGRSKQVLDQLSIVNKTTAKIRKKRSKEEAATRKVIYTKSEEFQRWWKENSKHYSRIHYAVGYFLKELGLSKSEFLHKMKEKGEYE